jgi:hypothetical protein
MQITVTGLALEVFSVIGVLAMGVTPLLLEGLTVLHPPRRAV